MPLSHKVSTARSKLKLRRLIYVLDVAGMNLCVKVAFSNMKMALMKSTRRHWFDLRITGRDWRITISFRVIMNVINSHH